jgi:Recombination endonuclease VII
METVKARIKRLWDMFKLTIEKWEHLLLFQDHKCWICGAMPEGRRLATDHDWKTGEVRGLLCHRCNTILGKIEKPGRSGQPWTIEELERAVSYKKNPPARGAWGAPHYGWPGSVTTKKHRKMLKRLAKISQTPR